MPLSCLARSHLSLWISDLLSAVPIRSRATFVELLCACLVSPEGWVTRAISAICRRRHWSTYYKLIERGSVRIVPLARAMFALTISVLAPDAIVLVVDDTLIPRGSASAPGCAIRFDHAHKTNRPDYLLSQNWVTLGLSVVTAEGRNWVLPILSRLVPSTGNRNKLSIALVLIRALAPVAEIPIRVLFDSWFMRARLVLPLLHRGCQVMGHARCDTALFLPPPPHSGRGRPRKFGDKLTRDHIDALPSYTRTLNLYGQEQLVRIRSVVALARFLRAAPVRAVWCEFFDDDRRTWSKSRLLLATDHFPIQTIAPWRVRQPLTAGLISQCLRVEFSGLPFRDGFDRKSQKFHFPRHRADPRFQSHTPRTSVPTG